MDGLIKAFEVAPLRKKILILGGVCLVLVAFLGSSYLLRNINQPALAPPSSQPPESPPQDSGEEAPIDGSFWQVYEGEGYKFSYPDTLVLERGLIQGGGDNVLLKGVKGNTAYTIELQVTNVSSSPTSDMYELFRSFGYAEEAITVDGIEGREFLGKFNNESWERIVVVENEEEVYKLQVSYTTENFDPYIEEIFRKLVATFEFT